MIANYYIHTVPLKKDVAEFLRQLEIRKVKMCVATASSRYLVEAALKRCGIKNYFSELFTCESVGYGKGTPHIYREAQKYLHTEKKETIVFEDAYHALKTAKDDGFLCAAVFDAHEPCQDKIRKEAHIYLKDFTDFEGFWNRIMQIEGKS